MARVANARLAEPRGVVSASTAVPRSHRGRRAAGLGLAAALLAAALAPSAQAASVGLGTDASFSVLGGTTVTNTGPSILAGDLGVAPGAAVVGFPPGQVGGTIHANDAVALQAKSDLVTAYDDAAGRPSTATISSDLAGLTLGPGAYSSASSLGLSGALTLDAHGDANAVFVFQAGSTLTTGSGSSVLLLGGAQACNVVWQVGSSATIGTATAFTGSILALTSISLQTGATVRGRALARNGAVTLDTNTFTAPSCATTGATGTAPATGATPGGGTTGTPPGSGTTGATPGTPTGPTAATPAKVSTGTATGIAADHARLTGTVSPGTSAGTYVFQFGTTRRYGGVTATSRARANRRQTVSALARRLRAGTLYHYRLVETQSGGRRTFGSDHTFRTPRAKARRARPARPARPTRPTPRQPHTAPRPPRTPSGFTG